MSPRESKYVPLLAAGTALLASCSLMGLDEFDAKRCRADSDCALANHKYLASSCGSYSCIDGQCLPPSGAERCGGGDEDCDGLIDEGDDLVSPLWSDGSPEAAPAVAVSFARDERSTLVVFPGDEATAVVLDATGARLGAVRAFGFSRDGSESPTPCPNEDGNSACNAKELALAGDERRLVYAAINTLGCAKGQVRLAISDRAEPFLPIVGKSTLALSPGDSNLSGGVGVKYDDEARRCTGYRDRSGAVKFGATRPAVAVNSLASGATGALALWLATPREGDDANANGCVSRAPIDVVALGAFVPRGESAPWLEGTDGGEPRVVGATSSFSAPAVVALGESQARGSYLVAFAGTHDGATGVLFAQPRVERGGLHIDGDPLSIIDDVEPGMVTLALGGNVSGQTEVGVVWSSGCGAKQQLKFTTRPDLATDTVGPIVALDAPNLASKPQLVHLESGFGVSDPTGGWVVTWLEAIENGYFAVRLARIRDSTYEVLNRATLRKGAVGAPLMFPDGNAALGFAFVHAADRIDSAPGWCD